MNKIAVLDKTTIDKIAAGEVVERPSSVVKELVENAIDAGATAVTVEITDGGKKLIRITDNGSGIEASQVRTAFLRHATSKIVKVEDLATIASLGFRGEALSSIAAVSQVELITKTPSAICGTRYLIEGGAEHSMEEIGAPDGTTFLVRNLFYNTPARSKFLHSDTTEGNYISTLMEQLALSHPEISFKYIQNKQVKLHTSGNYHVKDVIYSIYGRDITRSLLDVKYENDFMKMEGFVGKPEISRGNRSFENYYINGRYIKNRIISKAIEDAYKGFLMQHKFPFVSLHIEMEGNDLDVNVHPSKMEVRFSRGTEVYDAVYQSVRSALTRKEMIPTVSVGKPEKAPEPVRTESKQRGMIPEPFERSRFGAAKPDNGNLLREVPKPFSKMEEQMFTGTLREREAEAIRQESLKKQTEAAVPEKTAKITEHGSENIGLTPDKNAEVVTSKTEIESDTPNMQNANASPTYGVIKEDCVKNQKDVLKYESSVGSLSTMVPVQDSLDIHETSNSFTGDSNEKSLDTEEKVLLAEKEEQLSLFTEELLTPQSRLHHKLIGQLFETYWLVEFGDNFYIIDQHAAHEKINYERLVAGFRKQEIHSQYISPPMIVTLNLKEEAVLKENMEFFESFGFEIEHFGGHEYSISAVPTTLYGFEEEELFLEMLDHLAEDGKKDRLEIVASRIATMSCKAAVKGNNRLSYEEANRMIDELLTLENPYHCPHGRPTIISMTKYEMEKKFHRIV